jgi:hypothetical protein
MATNSSNSLVIDSDAEDNLNPNPITITTPGAGAGAGVKDSEKPPAVTNAAPDPIFSLTNLKARFSTATGTHAVAIAGILESAKRTLSPTTRNDSNDILRGSAKMYAGVTGKLDGTGTALETPNKWVYRLTDKSKITTSTHKSLTVPTTTTDVDAAKLMYTEIVTLTSTPYKQIDNNNFTSLTGYIPRGTNLYGNRFQLLFRYTPGASGSKINGSGYIRYGDDDADVKQLTITDSILQGASYDAMSVQKLISGLLDTDIFLSEDEAGMGPDAKKKAADDFLRSIYGGKISTKNRKMTSKKGGRNNSASRKQNKKGGAKARRSQKVGKRMR